MQKNIIIVGYPKSGTTWLSRLVAELVTCPLKGDWGFERIEALYKEGEDRSSKYQVYKSHHTLGEIENVSHLEIYKIIYIIRDPRDVVISGVHYFSFLPKLLAKKDGALNINRVLRKTYNRVVSFKEKKRQMIQAVLNGNKNITNWLTTSWKDHFTPYNNNNILFIKYESLIDSPERECKKILNYLEINRNVEHIKKSIEKQSFQQRKINKRTGEEKQLNKLLRKGKYGYWKTDFSKKEINLFTENLSRSNKYYNF